MGFFKSLFGGSNTPETEKEKNDKKNFEILKYDGIRARHMGKLPYAIKCFEEAVAINDEMETLTLLANAYIQANRLDDARITFNGRKRAGTGQHFSVISKYLLHAGRL